MSKPELERAISESFDDYLNARWTALVRMVSLMGADTHTAEDVVQSALARCYSRWERVCQTSDVDAYMHRSVINEFISSRRRFWTRELPGLSIPDRVQGDASEAIADSALIRSALAGLPMDQRQILVLRFFADMTEAQTADILNLPLGTVKSRASRALAKLSQDQSLGELSR